MTATIATTRTAEIVAELKTLPMFTVYAPTVMQAMFRPTPEQHAVMTRRADLHREFMGNGEWVNLGVEVRDTYTNAVIGHLTVSY
jgi:hypothetical protein